MSLVSHTSVSPSFSLPLLESFVRFVLSHSRKRLVPGDNQSKCSAYASRFSPRRARWPNFATCLLTSAVHLRTLTFGLGRLPLSEDQLPRRCPGTSCIVQAAPHLASTIRPALSIGARSGRGVVPSRVSFTTPSFACLGVRRRTVTQCPSSLGQNRTHPLSNRTSETFRTGRRRRDCVACRLGTPVPYRPTWSTRSSGSTPAWPRPPLVCGPSSPLGNLAFWAGLRPAPLRRAHPR